MNCKRAGEISPDDDEQLKSRKKIFNLDDSSLPTFEAHNDGSIVGKKFKSNSNEAIFIRFIDPSTDGSHVEDESVSFHPAFTYPFFGVDEVIIGYEDLRIELYYARGSLVTYLGVKYKSKDPEEVNATDIESDLSRYLSKDHYTNYDEFIEAAKAAECEFKPLGEKLAGIESTLGKGYSIYRAKFDTPGFHEYHEKFEIFFLMYIEGALQIQPDDKWEGYVLFEEIQTEKGVSYHAVAFCMAYAYLYYPDKTRMRISQFVILPPYRKKGMGEKFYRSLYNYFLSRDDIMEINVEDSNEAFDILRNKCDCKTLMERLNLSPNNIPMPDSNLTDIRRKVKLTDKQLKICLEILNYKFLNPDDKERSRLLRLAIKRRVYLQNYDQLNTMSKEERILPLEQTYKSIEEYSKRIAGLLNVNEVA